MKRIFIVMALMAPLAVSCNKSLDTYTTQSEDTITVSFIQPEDESGATKTTLIGSRELGWSTNDALYVSTPEKIGTGSVATDYSVYTTNAADGSQSASFTLTSGEAVYGSAYAVMYSAPVSDTYGYNSTKPTSHTNSDYLGKVFSKINPCSYLVAFIPFEQTYVQDGLAPYTMPMYGYCTDLNHISMTCLGSILRFNLYSSSEGKKVKEIILRGLTSTSSAQAIAGGYGISKDTGDGVYTLTPVNPDNYYGPWNIVSANYVGADIIKYECNDAAVSSDSSTPTQFNVVFGRHRNLNKISIHIELTSGETYDTVLAKAFNNNKVYSLRAKDIDSF